MAEDQKQEEQAKPALPPEEADLQERIKGFTDELKPLLGKYELGLGAQAGLTQDGRIGAQPIIVSTRGKADKKPDAGLSEG